MASKGPRSKLDHETRARRQKMLESPREPLRPKTHWDHVLEEMIWLSKDFEAERKWKLAQAKKVATKASRCMLDHATWGEKRMKEEEQRMRKVALNISKDVKKFWTKIEKLVLYKHQLELDDKKKKALDKQLEYLLGQTERYSTMLAENLMGTSVSCALDQPSMQRNLCNMERKESNGKLPGVSTKLLSDSKSHMEMETHVMEADDYSIIPSKEVLTASPSGHLSTQKKTERNSGEKSDNDTTEMLEDQTNTRARANGMEADHNYDGSLEGASEDDEKTAEEDEALITEKERLEELAALQNEIDLPLEELLKHYSIPEEEQIDKETREDTMESDDDFEISLDNELEDDEQTIEEDEASITEKERREELAGLLNEVDVPLGELLKRYSIPEVNGESCHEASDCAIDTHEEVGPSHNDETDFGSNCKVKSNGLLGKDLHFSEVKAYHHKTKRDDIHDSHFGDMDYDYKDEQGDDEFVIGTMEEKDDETTLDEEEEFAKVESRDPEDEIALLQKESEVPIQELLARYKMDFEDSGSVDNNLDYMSAYSDIESSPADQMVEQESQIVGVNDASEGVQLISTSTEVVVSSQVAGLEEESQRDARIADAAAAARSAQPTGNTFSTTNVRTKYPFLMKHSLREYQHIGLDWLVTMYEKRLNGILADEMGLGKTIMTIALLAYLACEKGIWGPHLIVVPTSVMLNWETEFLKWCPAFKILTYFGSAKERKYKRQGWMKPNSFHVCITTYRLVIQDANIFKRKKWKYLILDEAHLIKNWKSQRWQTLLNFNSKRRILLTGTPLQNDLMELWSLMHFLMPHIFQSHQEFKDWFCNPISGMVEGQEKVNKEVIDRLHNVLRPFILRRLKRDVETQLPMKKEHVIYCRLSKRQRNLYEDFIASSDTQATLASANFIGMLNVIMQLRKVCNHPDLFEGRPIVSSFDMEGLELQLSSSVCSMLLPQLMFSADLTGLGFLFTQNDFSMTSWESDEVQSIATPSRLIECRGNPTNLEVIRPDFSYGKKYLGTNIFEEIRKAVFEERLNEAKRRAAAIAWWNSLRCGRKPLYSTTLRELLSIMDPVYDICHHKKKPMSYEYSSKLADIILSPVQRFQQMINQVEAFMFAIPAVRAPSPACWCSKSGTSVFIDPFYKEQCSEVLLPLLTPIRPAIVRRHLYFPDRRLIQFDCGKLQQLAILLRRLKSEGRRALIFTQMTKMLDILEAFINLYGYTYMRLDGSTQPEERQTLMQRFNTNPKIFLFILSTRSGGVGINLVGADTVIFYDSDWNPAMDQQAQDRCHRIGQTREVHIYRLISESTIEENILKKANQKRALDDLVIQSGGYNTEFFKKLDPMELFSGHRITPVKSMEKGKKDNGLEVPVSNADIEAALRSAEDEADYMALKKVEEEEAVDNQEFTEEAIGRMEDEDLTEDVLKSDECAEQNALVTASSIGNVSVSNENDVDGGKVLSLTSNEDEVDVIADVKQMAAAAAAAGQEVLSFENQLRPIDRYAMRFLELWDPIIDMNATACQIQFEEREWELERIEKLKGDMEAEVDDDDEPLVYEKWDVEFATQAYHQQVEALAQHQLMEELESRAKEIENENANAVTNEISNGDRKKSKKKKKTKQTKKTKFKSLKITSSQKALQEDEDLELLSSDNEGSFQDAAYSSDTGSSPIMLRRKRKKDETTTAIGEETVRKIKFKKPKRSAFVTTLPSADSLLLSISPEDSKDARPIEEGGTDFDLKSAGRNKMGGKVSIATMPMKKIYTIKPEKLKKKGNMWSSDCFPYPDSWLPQEDAVLCALVHEYGPNWSLVSDILYCMPAGGRYRGRFRHPVLCCERFRELVQKYVHAVADSLNNEKTSTAGPAKGLLRVTEDNIRVLLDAAMEQPDRELLLQRHFTALLTSVWKTSSSLDQQRARSTLPTNHFPSIRLFGTSVNPNAQNSARGPSKKCFNLGQVNLITAALHDAGNVGSNAPDSNHMEVDLSTVEKLDVIVEFGSKRCEIGDSSDHFPSLVSLSILDLDRRIPVKASLKEEHLKSSQELAESRYRVSSCACLNGALGWASCAFPVTEPRSRSSMKSPSSGKHKLGAGETNRHLKSKVRKVANEPSDAHPLYAEPLLSLLPTLTENSHFHGTADLSYENLLLDMLDGDSERLSFDTSHFEMVPHCYNPSFVSGLDDCCLLEYTDFG